MTWGANELRRVDAELERLWAHAETTRDTRARAYIIQPTNALEMLLKGHLYIESLLISLIEAAAVEPAALELDRLGFANKVAIAAAIGGLPSDMAPAVRRLNKLRNEVAHRLDVAITAEQVNEIHSLLPERLRAIRQEHWAHIDDAIVDLRLTLFVIATHIDSVRVQVQFDRGNAVLLAEKSALDSIKEFEDEHGPIRYWGPQSVEPAAAGSDQVPEPPGENDGMAGG